MKIALGLLLGYALFTTSCKHDKPVAATPDFGQGTGHCRLKGITHPNDSRWGSSRLYYDNDNRLIRVEHWGTGQPPGNTFTYHDSTIIATHVDSKGMELFRDSIVLNAKGQMIYSAQGTQQHITSNYERLCTYNSAQQLVSSSIKQLGTVVETRYYTWNNGNVVVDSFGPGAAVRYEYYNKNFQYASQHHLADFLSVGAPVWKPKQLVSSSQASTVPGTVVQHFYTFDADGKVLTDSLYNTGTKGGYLTAFEYECK